MEISKYVYGWICIGSAFIGLGLQYFLPVNQQIPLTRLSLIGIGSYIIILAVMLPPLFKLIQDMIKQFYIMYYKLKPKELKLTYDILRKEIDNKKVLK